MLYIGSFLAAAALSLVLTPLFRRLGVSLGLIDTPSPRRVHTIPTVRGGGTVIFVSFWLVILALLVGKPALLQFIDTKVLGVDQNLLGVFIGAVILLTLGLYDDYRPLPPFVKLIFHIVAAVMPVAFGIRVWWLSNPLGGLNIVLGNWTYLFVPAWLVLMINVMNWLDGLDGLATGVATIASFVLIFLSLAPFVNQPATALMAAILAGAAAGFLPYNFHPAKIFLGDSGSQFLGYMIGIFAIISGGKVATASLVMGIPILDAFWVIARRVFTNQSPFKADRRHLHHRLLAIGLTQPQTVLIYYAVAAVFGMIALATKTYGKFIAGFWLFSLMVVIALTVLLKQRPYERH